jgi:hypothetical protein
MTFKFEIYAVSAVNNDNKTNGNRYNFSCYCYSRGIKVKLTNFNSNLKLITTTKYTN